MVLFYIVLYCIVHYREPSVNVCAYSEKVKLEFNARNEISKLGNDGN